MNQVIEQKDFWGEALSQIELSVSKPNFSTWFKDTFIMKQEDGVIFLGVSSTFARDWLQNKFHKLILKTLREISDQVRAVEYVVAKKDKKLSERKVDTIQILNKELPLSDFYVNKDDNLNPRYTFDSFIVGPFNELAYAAAQAIIKQPGVVYNPLFIYGNTGHGKTHLIQAVGNQIKNNMKEKRVYYINSEQFANDYVEAVRSNKFSNFKEKYKKYDVLIMDDVQFFSNTEKIQEELFHLFNMYYDNNKQILFSSDKHPNYIPNLEDRLKSRFSQGMIVDIPNTDKESRILIIKSKLDRVGTRLNDEIISFLAETIDGNIRELEGVVNSVSCQTQLKNRDLSLNEVKDLIKNTAKPKKSVSVQNLIKIVSDYFNIDEKTITERTRKKEVVIPRQLVMYILREDFGVSYPTIGEKLGGRDHTTVIHSCEKMKVDLKVDSTLNQQLNQIRSML